MKNKWFATGNLPLSVDITVLLIRVAFGAAFILHGWGKIQHPLNWMGPQSNYPAIFQALSAIAEFCGGIALILGLLTRLAAFGLTCNMLVAVHLVMMVMHNPFVSMNGGHSYEMALLYLLLSLFFLANGPGRFSLDRVIFGSK
jgi:putative oxidoreductase